ncbi:hypothetical protein [Paenibacillus xanthanilyticus]|uniref:Uncharacterized protein n=1 Tax=Paenibacillus xanthanilyticus TaxID=1783531 RepID=A0ABV8KA49_9BACL
MAVLFYVGPTIEGLVKNTTFKGSLPANVSALLQKYPILNRLLVAVDQSVAATRAAKTPGTLEYEAYVTLGGIVGKPDAGGSSTGGGGGGGVTATAGPLDVTLHANSNAPGNGETYTAARGNERLTFSVRGNSTARKVRFELADLSGIFVPITAFSVTDPAKYSTETTGGRDTAPESWTVSVPAGWTFRAPLESVSAGGNVIVRGKAVIVNV